MTILFSFLLIGCSDSSEQNTPYIPTPAPLPIEKLPIEILPLDMNDIDKDGLADKYEKEFGLIVGVKDADDIKYDPIFSYQWYLSNKEYAPQVTNNILVAGEDINIEPVWRKTLGDDIVVSVVDTGIDSLHNDLIVDLNNSYRYSDNSNDPSPTSAQLYEDSEGAAHGTACAGIIASSSWNEIGSRGVAPKATLVGLNVFSKPSDSSFSLALQKEGIDVSSNSWGGGGANFLYDDISSLQAIENGITNGRDKKGIAYIFASGNDEANANFQSVLTSGYVIAVSAVDGAGKLEYYSDFGVNILVSAPGGAKDGNQEPGIVTTDLSGLKNGLDNYYMHWDTPTNEDGNYTHLMNGTSASCPIVAGVVTLMLSVNKNLTYKDIQYILATTARKNDSLNSSWEKNGAGYHISDKYGFGVVDAEAAVNKAIDFISLGDEQLTTNTHMTNTPIDTANTKSFEFIISDTFLVTQAIVDINTNHDNPGKLKIVLESPSGTKSTLAYGDTVLYDKYSPWQFLSLQMLDETSSGKWILHITDIGEGNSGNLTNYSLHLKGYKR